MDIGNGPSLSWASNCIGFAGLEPSNERLWVLSGSRRLVESFEAFQVLQHGYYIREYYIPRRNYENPLVDWGQYGESINWTKTTESSLD